MLIDFQGFNGNSESELTDWLTAENKGNKIKKLISHNKHSNAERELFFKVVNF